MHPSLQIRQIGSLPSPIKALATSAASGILAHLHELLNELDKAPVSHINPCIPAFYVHLDVQDLPHLREKQKTRPYTHLHPEPPWMRLDEINTKRAPGLKPTADIMRMAFLRLILGFCPDPRPSSFTSQPRIRELVAAGWAAAVKNPYGKSHPLTGDCDWCWGHDERSGIGYLEDHSPGHFSGPHSVLVHLGITLLHFANHPSLAPHLASHGIVDILSSALGVFGESVSSRMTPVISWTLSRLLVYMDIFPCMTRVKEGLDGGLLRAIVLSCISDHSVLSNLRAALDDVEPLTHSDTFRDSKIFETWQVFVQVATERLDLLEKFDRGEIGQTRACDYIECTSPIKEDADLLRCSRCRSAFYCSKECQSQDWIPGHKKPCESLLQRETELAFLAPELKFLRATLNHDYEHARADITAVHTRVLETEPNALCAVMMFDYCRVGASP
ncbi:hypothetical protein FB45DRAFT_1084783 [Roridomyces roridus]|uniref:MYND-type domain-containing protein n=1 Tax=Roridomyces roridus TaxID=1738132 RepID=A0AAD7BN80_9AGAR|nr:hypothetical protein FB45DRAFT_1084783 [Roridomyces roridus]